MTRQRLSRLALAATAVLATTSAAHAAIVEYSFQVAIDSGVLAGQNYAGSLSFDDAQAPGMAVIDAPTFVLTSFDFSFEGTAYTMADFPGDALLWAMPAGETPGLDGGTGPFSFQPGLFGQAPSFAYTGARGGG